MDAGKLADWIRRPRKGRARLRLQLQEFSATAYTIAEWPVEEITEHANPTELVLDACADTADSRGESINVRVEWLRADGTVIAHCSHRQAPIENADGEPVSPAAKEADISVPRLLAHLIQKDLAKDKLIVGAIGAIFAPMESTIRIQQQMIDSQGRQIINLSQQLQAAMVANGEESTEENRAESVARTNAYNKMAEVGPLALQALVEHVITRNRAAANGSGH